MRDVLTVFLILVSTFGVVAVALQSGWHDQQELANAYMCGWVESSAGPKPLAQCDKYRDALVK